MDPIFDKLMILSVVFLTYMDASLSFQFISTFMILISLILFNRYGYILDDVDYFPDDVTFVDEKKAYR